MYETYFFQKIQLLFAALNNTYTLGKNSNLTICELSNTEMFQNLFFSYEMRKCLVNRKEFFSVKVGKLVQQLLSASIISDW
jgi:hypothetical protein